MRVEQFRQLIEIVKQDSITNAAKNLNISQPALSNSMKRLEESVGFTIFCKNGNNIHLTKRGEELYICAKRIIKELDIIDNLSMDVDACKDNLTISNSFSMLAKDNLIDLYNKYSKDQITCRFEDCSISNAIDNVSTGISELGIIRYPCYKTTHLSKIFESKNIECVELAYENACVVVGKKNPLYYIENDYIDVEHLKNQTFITYNNEIKDNIWINFLTDLHINYSRVSLANVGHVMDAVKNTDLLFVDTKKDHTHSDWYDHVRYIELRPEVPCALSYIKIKNRQLSDIGQDYIDMLTERINIWRQK